MTHLSFEDLLLARDASGGAAPEHVSGGCVPCGRRWRLLEELLSDLARPPLPEVPRSLLARAEAVFRSGAGLAAGLRRWLADLREDTRGLELAGSLRGAGTADRRLRYRADPYELELVLFDGVTLTGHLDAPDPDDPLIHEGICVLAGAASVRDAPLSSHGDFHLGEVEPGDYKLLIEAPGRELWLPAFTLAEPERP